MTIPDGVTTDMLARLRRMVNEPFIDVYVDPYSIQTPYTDDVLGYYIGLHPVTDSNGIDMNENDWLLYLDYRNSETSYADLVSTGALPVWTPTWDLHAAAADIWEEKAALVQTYYNYSADGGNYSQSQLFQTAMEQSRYHAARRKSQSRFTHKSPVERRFDVMSTGYMWWRS